MSLKHFFLSQCRLSHRWIKPDGYNSDIKIYNCITKIKEPLILNNKKVISWYTCGPTVYDSAHIGHATCYVKTDIIQRILRKYFRYNLVTVTNITDIDDKIIKRSHELNVPCNELSRSYEEEFWTELEQLNIEKPNLVLRVTENIQVIKDFIGELIKSGFAYKADDGSVYFNVNKSISYGKLQQINDIEAIVDKIKKTSADFVLWKAAKTGEPFWDSDWGPGRPGWHIECSALAGTVFGSQIDIHSGGIDLRFPHHENEEAQSCAFFSVPQWVNYWLHIGHLHLKNEKMSKSLKNTISVSELLKNCSADVFRMACLMSHYRSSMEYSENMFTAAENTLNKLKFTVNDCDAYIKGKIKGGVNRDVLNKAIAESYEEIHSALLDDLDTPTVVRTLNKLSSLTSKMLHSTECTSNLADTTSLVTVKNLIVDALSVFGIQLNSFVKHERSDISDIMNVLNDFRQHVRQLGIEKKDGKLLELCDVARNDIKKCGITINDYGKQSSWVK